METNDQGATEDDFMQASELNTDHKYPPRPRFSRKSFRLDIKPFDGREVYKDLGANFIAWGRQLIDKMVKGEEEMGRWWTEQEKLMVLGDNLAGEAARYFQDNKDLWWNSSQSYQYALDQLAIAYSVRLQPRQARLKFEERKSKNRTWNEHYLYLSALNSATGGAF
ncbi:MAG: hypothetical protein GY836_08030, partial [Herbaspirillum sp.]|uniref:hypothetical protein n=1 Tax=Herbaspirillum sp. TaxID=1890675 RepID=UPI0025872710